MRRESILGHMHALLFLFFLVTAWDGVSTPEWRSPPAAAAAATTGFASSQQRFLDATEAARSPAPTTLTGAVTVTEAGATELLQNVRYSLMPLGGNGARSAPWVARSSNAAQLKSGRCLRIV